MGGRLRITAHNVTKGFNGTNGARAWGAFRLNGGMCGWEQYLLEKRAMCRMARVAEPCGSPDAHGVRRANFFPQLLAWDDDSLTLVVTNDGCSLLRQETGDRPDSLPAEMLRADGLAATVGIGEGNHMSCARQISPPGACGHGWKPLSNSSFQEQLDCAASQLRRANATHLDANCKNVFVRPNGRMTLYHPITNPECKKCAVMCRNNAPVGYCDKEDGCGAEHELAYMNMRLLPKGQRTLKNGEAKYLKDSEKTYRVCESASMSFLKTKRSCAKHSGPGADATCKGWCEKWYTDTHNKGRLAALLEGQTRSREYGICAGYTDEDWDKVAQLLVNNPTSKGKITKKDLDRGRGGEVTRLLFKQDE